MSDKKIMVAFAALDPYLEKPIPTPKETDLRGRNIVEWGTGNTYPDYLLELYNSVPTLRSIINGNVDFIAGDGVIIDNDPAIQFNPKESAMETVRKIARDYEIYGGFALQVIRNGHGEVAEVYHVDMRYLRTDKECQVFRYSEKWGESGRKALVYPAFIPQLPWEVMTDEERDRQASSIVYVKNEYTQVYPAPLYAAAVKDCETERDITDYHLTSILNGFSPSAIINFNNGEPSDEDKASIEADVRDKFCGPANAGRFLLSFNGTRANATTFEFPDVKDFGEKYRALATHCRQQIFTAFQATPNLFGIPTDNNGFSNDEYAEAFKLYNRTHIIPVQMLICDAFDKIYGRVGRVVITPFSLGEDDTTQTLATQLGVGGTQAMMAVLESETLTIEQKKGALEVLFGLDEENASKLLGITYIPPANTE